MKSFAHPEHRAKQIVSLAPFQTVCHPSWVKEVELNCPHEEQHILRMLVRLPHQIYKIPKELKWLRGIIEIADDYQKRIMRVVHPYVYVTVRHGKVKSVTDDEWHTDGFSTKVTHLPESNYVAVSNHQTEVVGQAIVFPMDFDPLIHNVHKFIAGKVKQENVKSIYPNTLYCMDPYVIHRRPPGIEGVHRTFIRITHAPIEIMDDANTENPYIVTRRYQRDGISIRNQLKDYDNE